MFCSASEIAKLSCLEEGLELSESLKPPFPPPIIPSSCLPSLALMYSEMVADESIADSGTVSPVFSASCLAKATYAGAGAG